MDEATCNVCYKPITEGLVTARYEGWVKNFHTLCFVEAARAEFDMRHAKAARLEKERDEFRSGFRYLYEACEGCCNFIEGEEGHCVSRCIRQLAEPGQPRRDEE